MTGLQNADRRLKIDGLSSGDGRVGLSIANPQFNRHSAIGNPSILNPQSPIDNG
jgi:hypothetical protein